jgi:hypothetical protein
MPSKRRLKIELIHVDPKTRKRLYRKVVLLTRDVLDIHRHENIVLGTPDPLLNSLLESREKISAVIAEYRRRNNNDNPN